MRFLYLLSLSAMLFYSLLVTGCGGSAASVNSKNGTSGTPSAGAGNQGAAGNGITIDSPSNGANVGSPFTVQATATSCDSSPVISVGYSLDNSSSTQAQSGTVLNVQAEAGNGTHVLHVKSWSSAGGACSQDVTVQVAAVATPSNASVPGNATVVSDIQNYKGWTAAHDDGSGGSSSGAMSMTDSPSMSGHARRFDTSYSGSGGEIYTDYFDSDVNAKNFFYDAWVYLDDSAGNIVNLEMDMNQVLANGQTVIFGVQCDGWTGTWDYTANTGSAKDYNDQWLHTSAYCDPRNWGRNQWHHFQASYSRDDGGNVTYHAVYLDGLKTDIETTTFAAFDIGWAPALMTNFQVDGSGEGSSTAYLDNLTISRW